jgi:hypothetical protein
MALVVLRISLFLLSLSHGMTLLSSLKENIAENAAVIWVGGLTVASKPSLQWAMGLHVT